MRDIANHRNNIQYLWKRKLHIDFKRHFRIWYHFVYFPDKYIQGSTPNDILMREGVNLLDPSAKQCICAQCGEVFTSNVQYTKHCLSMHKDRQDLKDKNCQACRMIFKNKPQSTAHKFAHHRNRNLKIPNISPQEYIKFKETACYKCAKIFYKKWSLKRHFLEMHTPATHQCILCYATIKGREKAKDHLWKEHKNDYLAVKRDIEMLVKEIHVPEEVAYKDQSRVIIQIADDVWDIVKDEEI